MIIVPNDCPSSSSSKADKWATNLKAGMPLSTNEKHDPPPSYLDTAERLSTISTLDRPCTTPNIKPCNFISLNYANESIKGSWLIDPSLSIPLSFLPPLPAGGARKNLVFESKNGAIDADIFLLSTSYSNKNTSKFILIHTQSQNGTVKTRLHDTKSLNGEIRLPIRLSTRSSNGSVHVQLPRSFCGPIRIRTTNGSTHFSASIQAQLTVFSEMDRVQRSFLGHFNPSQWDIGAPWEGDELSTETKNGNVKISFDDETNPSLAVPHGPSFLSRFLADLSM